MSHTDPQDDIPCTACETEGPRSRLDDDGVCRDCRTPAGRLVTALLAAGIEDAEAVLGRSAVSVGCLTIDVDEDGRWAIDGHDEDGITAADAIAAIVQAPGLRAERDTLAARVAALEAHNGRMVAAWLEVASACDAARNAFGSKWGENGGAENVACFLPGETWAKTGDAIRDLAGGAS